MVVATTVGETHFAAACGARDASQKVLRRSRACCHVHTAVAACCSGSRLRIPVCCWSTELLTTVQAVAATCERCSHEYTCITLSCMPCACVEPEVARWCHCACLLHRLMAMVLGINLRDMPIEEARYAGKH
jgi:hypothetical protein